jgi:hypothetical protein
MQTTTAQAEIGLDQIDESIARADRNIQALGSLLPELAISGHSTAELEDQLTFMTKALHSLRAQRRTILDTLDGDEPLPRIARPVTRTRRRSITLDSAAVVASRSTGGTWRAIYMRLRRSA